MSAPTAHVEDWTGKNATVSEIEHELARLRDASEASDDAPDLRTSVMTHIAWVPKEWLKAASETLAGLAERHPSRTILLVPQPESKRDAIDAELSLRCFPLAGQERHVCSEVIELHLLGARAAAPASVVQPLLISDLPAFLRWRGRPPFGEPEAEQLLGVADRLVVDSAEWPDLPGAYAELAARFDQVGASDIAWGRGLGWRISLAGLWPGIAKLRALRVRGPQADALLLAGWLRSRLGVELELEHEEAETLAAVTIDGEEVEPPRGERPSASDLLSEELDRFGRDPIYEAAVAAA